jgi:hypothetical protein
MNTVCFFISFRGVRTCDGVGPSLVLGLPSFVLLAFSVVRLFRPGLPARLRACLEGVDEPVVVLVLGTPRPGRQVGGRRVHGFDGAHSSKGERCSHFLISWIVVYAISWLWDGFSSWVRDNQCGWAARREALHRCFLSFRARERRQPRLVIQQGRRAPSPRSPP